MYGLFGLDTNTVLTCAVLGLSCGPFSHQLQRSNVCSTLTLMALMFLFDCSRELNFFLASLHRHWVRLQWQCFRHRTEKCHAFNDVLVDHVVRPYVAIMRLAVWAQGTQGTHRYMSCQVLCCVVLCCVVVNGPQCEAQASFDVW